MELFETITNRRSTRKFISKPVEDEKIMKIIDAAHWAPSAGNLQEWQFVVVRDSGRKMQLSEAALGQYWINQASAIIAVYTKDEKMVRIYGDVGKKRFIYYDAAVAIQNMLLTAHSLGLGACFVGSLDETAVGRILKIPDNTTIHALIPIGYPAEKPVTPHRLGLETMIFFEEHGRTWIKNIPSSIRSDFPKKV
jgi:nitroreductase